MKQLLNRAAGNTPALELTNTVTVKVWAKLVINSGIANSLRELYND